MDIAKAIIEANARYDIKDEHGKTAFDWIETEGLKERYNKIVKDYKLSVEYKTGSKKDVIIQIILYNLFFLNKLCNTYIYIFFLLLFFIFNFIYINHF